MAAPIETESMVLFWRTPILGQWCKSNFEVANINYCCAEQFMMAEKARLFGDDDILKEIMSTTSPRKHQELGRKISGFNQELWEHMRLDIVVEGNLAKFKQNPTMAEALIATGNKILVEASPDDRIWGVGLLAEDPRIHFQEKWLGLNLLGKALMIVREGIK